MTSGYDMHPTSQDARDIARALADYCAQHGASWCWFDEQRSIFTLSTGDKDFFVSVDEQSPELDVETERREYLEKDRSMETLLALEQEQLAAYPETEEEA